MFVSVGRGLEGYTKKHAHSSIQRAIYFISGLPLRDLASWGMVYERNYSEFELVETNLAFATKEYDPCFSRLTALVLRFESQGSSLRETSRQGNGACLNDPILLILFLFAWHRVYGPKPSFVFGQYPSVAFAGVNCDHFASNCKKLYVVIQL